MPNRRLRTTDRAGRKTTIVALSTNIGVALAKLTAWLFTGSASVLAEAVHSLADSANQGLLLVGRRRSRHQATTNHPFGFGRERYFWAFVVAMVLFTGGALFALAEGIEKIRTPHELASTRWAVAVLVVAFALEATSLRTAVRESRGRKQRDETWLAFVRRTSVPELAVVLLEDSGALAGVTLALAGTVAADVTGNSRWDAAGSVGIGILLAAIALTLATEMKSLLIGEAAQRRDVIAIEEALRDQPLVTTVDDLRTEQLGPDDVLVVGSLSVSAHSAAELDAARTDAERAVRTAVPSARLVYLRAQPDPETSTSFGDRSS